MSSLGKSEARNCSGLFPQQVEASVNFSQERRGDMIGKKIRPAGILSVCPCCFGDLFSVKSPCRASLSWQNRSDETDYTSAAQEESDVYRSQILSYRWRQSTMYIMPRILYA